MHTSLRFQPLESLSSVLQRLAHLLISTEVRSTEARFGAHASTAQPTGRWSRRALHCRRPTAAPRHHPCPWCSSVFWSACSFCSKHAAIVISTFGGRERGCSKQISTRL